jgi:hypothetical protein
MERDRSKSSSAPRRARLRVTGAGCSRALGVLELPGTPRTTQRYSRNRNLQPRGSLAQSRRRIGFIAGDERIVAPVCVVADIPRRPRTRRRRRASQSYGSSSRLGPSTPPLDLICCPASSGQQPHPAAITLSGNAPTIVCASAVLPRTRPQHAWRSRAAGWQPHSAAIIFCGNSPTITNLRQHAVFPTRASLSSAKPRK